MPPAFADYLATACLSKEMAWKIRGVEAKSHITRRGTPQGCSLPVVHALVEFLRARSPQAAVIVYADDIVFLTPTPELLAE
eukprot:150180-Amphidinium_carterae.1